jgi:hypothetical protein
VTPCQACDIPCRTGQAAAARTCAINPGTLTITMPDAFLESLSEMVEICEDARLAVRGRLGAPFWTDDCGSQEAAIRIAFNLTAPKATPLTYEVAQR